MFIWRRGIRSFIGSGEMAHPQFTRGTPPPQFTEELINQHIMEGMFNQHFMGDAFNPYFGDTMSNQPLLTGQTSLVLKVSTVWVL
jgi:hypothetical protein